MLVCFVGTPSLVARQETVPGDVGTFDLMDGFIKIFNIWEDETFAYQLPPNECITRPNHISEGNTVVSGISAKACRSEDGRWV
jgi:hypothetical protein